jgi:hypothetical protein
MVLDIGMSHQMEIPQCPEHGKFSTTLYYFDPVVNVEWKLEKVTKQLTELEKQRTVLINEYSELLKAQKEDGNG